MIRLQSAMEYLMTYGWAILAIAIVMVSLYSLGIFNTGNLQPTATPGSCEVVRTSAQTSLAGQCSNLIPKYVGQFAQAKSTYINVTNAAPLNPTSTMTICAWDKSTTATTQYIVSKGASQQYEIMRWSTGQADAGMYVGGAWKEASGAIIESINTWYFECGTYDGSHITVYTNGTADGTPLAATGSLSSTSLNLRMGRRPDGYAFNGSIANVQIYNTSLDAASIKALYQEGIGGAPIDVQRLIGWWPLNGNAKDYSGNNNGGAIHGSVAWNANWQSGYSSPSS